MAFACPTSCPPNFALMPNTCFPQGGGPAGGSCYPLAVPSDCGPNQTYIPPGGLLTGPRYGPAGMVTLVGGCVDNLQVTSTPVQQNAQSGIWIVAGIGAMLFLVMMLR